MSSAEQAGSTGHPVAAMLRRCLAGDPVPVDGAWERTPPWFTGPGAPHVLGVVATTGHAYVVAPDAVSDAEIDALGADGFGGAHDPRLMARLAGDTGWIDILDAVLGTTGTGATPDTAAPADPTRPTALPLDSTLALVPRPDLADHPRVARARSMRTGVTAYGLVSGGDDVVLTVGRGVGGLAEMSLELAPGRRGRGLGTALARAARALVPAGEPVLACVSPGNVPSFRALLGAGYRPLASVQLLLPDGPRSGA